MKWNTKQIRNRFISARASCLLIPVFWLDVWLTLRTFCANHQKAEKRKRKDHVVFQRTFFNFEFTTQLMAVLTAGLPLCDIVLRKTTKYFTYVPIIYSVINCKTSIKYRQKHKIYHFCQYSLIGLTQTDRNDHTNINIYIF